MSLNRQTQYNDDKYWAFCCLYKKIYYSFNNQKTWPEPGAVLPEPGAVSVAVLSEFIAEREFGEAVSSSL